MKILLFIIFSESDIYNQMLDIQQSYIHLHPHIDTYFVTFNETQSEDILLVNNILYIKGRETYTNILYKTIQSLNYVFKELSSEYDYVIRSNISTIIDLTNLYTFASTLPKTGVYTGGTLETLRWSLQPYEISQDKQSERNSFYGLTYFQGTSIIISSDIAKNLLTLKDQIEFDIVDDVKLGLLMKEYSPDIYDKIGQLPIAKVTYSNYDQDCVFIRNRSIDRKWDIHIMRETVKKCLRNGNISINVCPNFDKVIHIVHKNIDDKLLNVKREWEILNPEYKVELYDDTKCIQLLQHHYGKKMSDIFEFIKDGPIKCDFFRVCLLYINGGVYVDADIKPLVPLNEYLQEDIDLMTCISYNYTDKLNTFNYNPQIIACKKYSSDLFNIIDKYTKLYDLHKDQYSYWAWSICTLFHTIHNFDIKVNSENIFVYNNLKYQFIIENILDKQENMIYDFSNFRQHKEMLLKRPGLDVYCSYMDKKVLENFTNK